MVQYRLHLDLLRSRAVMICLFSHTRGRLTVLVLLASVSFTLSTAFAAPVQKKSKGLAPGASVAQRYAEAVSRGDKIEVAKLDFACQYRVVAATKSGLAAYPDQADASYDTCWQGIKASHEAALTRVDVGMDVLWPSNGALPFFREDLSRYPASAFVMDLIGLSPPGSGLHLKAVSTRTLPNASFRPHPHSPLVSVPTTLVTITVAYQDPLTAPITKAPGS